MSTTLNLRQSFLHGMNFVTDVLLSASVEVLRDEEPMDSRFIGTLA